MAFNALRSTLRRDSGPAAPADGPVEFAPGPADPTADGGVNASAFPCPSCGRTLASGARRCDGCGQRLVLDVPIGRASKLAGGGALAGILVTLLLVNVFAPPRSATAVDDAQNGAGTGNGSTATVAVPAAAAAALRGTTAINGRLAAEADGLAAALDAKSFKTADVVKVLRRMNIDTRAGAAMVRAFASWPEAAGQQAALGAFYADLASEIDAGLDASVRSTSAYKKATKAILTTLGQVPGLDADARALASSAGTDLAPVDIPAVLR